MAVGPDGAAVALVSRTFQAAVMVLLAELVMIGLAVGFWVLADGRGP